MRRPIRILLIILLFPPTLAAVGGWLAGPAFIHPMKRELTPELVGQADITFAQIGVHRNSFDVRASDGVLLGVEGQRCELKWELGFGVPRRGGQSDGRS
jgi:hypothetical protein